VEILAARIPATDGAAALAQVHAEHAALYAATEPVTQPHPASPPGSELAVAACAAWTRTRSSWSRPAGVGTRQRRPRLRCRRGNGHRPVRLTGNRRPPGAPVIGEPVRRRDGVLIIGEPGTRAPALHPSVPSLREADERFRWTLYGPVMRC
jgi:hypothetical protein